MLRLGEGLFFASLTMHYSFGIVFLQQHRGMRNLTSTTVRRAMPPLCA